MTLKTKRVEYLGTAQPEAPEGVTWTEAASEDVRRRMIGDVVSRVDRGYALDLVVALQLRARVSEDTGERLTLDEFAREEGWEDELNELRSQQ